MTIESNAYDFNLIPQSNYTELYRIIQNYNDFKKFINYLEHRKN